MKKIVYIVAIVAIVEEVFFYIAMCLFQMVDICKRTCFKNLASKNTLLQHTNRYSVLQGRNWVILRGGCRYIYDRKEKIVHSLSQSVKCGAPLIRDMALAKVCNAH